MRLSRTARRVAREDKRTFYARQAKEISDARICKPWGPEAQEAMAHDLEPVVPKSPHVGAPTMLSEDAEKLLVSDDLPEPTEGVTDEPMAASAQFAHAKATVSVLRFRK